MKNLICVFAVSLLFASVALGRTPQDSTNLSPQGYQTNLTPDATLRLHLHEGDFRVIGGDSNTISIHAEGKNIDQANNIKIQIKRTGTDVDLTLSHVPKKELQVTIAIPRSTNLYTRMKGGDLAVQDVVGDKDLELTGGDLTIQVGNADDYSHVDLSVKFGDISGRQFGDPKGWIGNSLQKDGTGKYKLHAHVMAGDLVLKS
jgi:hypothetical protein